MTKKWEAQIPYHIQAPRPHNDNLDAATVVDEFLTIKDVATRIKKSPRSVWRLIQAGKLVAHDIGGSTRIRVRDLQKYFKSARRRAR